MAMSCGIDHRRGSDLALLWLWCRPVATALIRSLAWEPPYAVSAALERQSNKGLKAMNKTRPRYWPRRVDIKAKLH